MPKICTDCGFKHGGNYSDRYEFTRGRCEWCAEFRQVTEATNYGVTGEGNLIADCGCRFEHENTNSVILCDTCAELPCHTGK